MASACASTAVVRAVQSAMTSVSSAPSGKSARSQTTAPLPNGSGISALSQLFRRMAKLSKAPVLFVGLSCNPAIRLNNWDRTLIPLPFGKGAVVWDRADFPEGAELAGVIADWTARTTAVEAEADALTGLERV